MRLPHKGMVTSRRSFAAQKQWLTLLREQTESASKAAFYGEKLCDAHFYLSEKSMHKLNPTSFFT